MNIENKKHKNQDVRGIIAAAALRTAGLLLVALALPGCAEIALSALGPAAQFGFDHAFSGGETKTFTAPMANLRLAALKTMSRMEMDVTKDGGTDDEWNIEAEAGDRTIDIDFKSLTAMTTRIRVGADNGDIIFKDSATATEVVAQMTEALKSDTQVAEQTALEDSGDGR
jgi:hypothetical protein